MLTKKQRRFLRKTVKLRKVNKVDNIKIKQKGIQYTVEPVDVLSNDPKMKGDIVKKHVNGKLVQQKFITYGKSKIIIAKQADKLKNIQKGGLTKQEEEQLIKLQKKKLEEGEKQGGKTEIVYKDGTGFFGNVKNSAGAMVGSGAGLAFNIIAAGALAKIFGDSQPQQIGIQEPQQL